MTAKVEVPPKIELNRRDFLVSTAAAGGAMVLGFYLPPQGAHAAAVAGRPWYPDAMVPEINAWLTIAPDDTVTIRVAQTEMGTGVFTSCPMMVAEELQCDWSKVRAEYASPHRNFTEPAPEWTLRVPGGGDPLLRDGGGEPAAGSDNKGVYRRMATGSSGSVRESRYYLQMAGAEARERLLLAAAAMWDVPTSELKARNSVVSHAASGRRITYGAIAARAAHVTLPDPSKIKIKGPAGTYKNPVAEQAVRGLHELPYHIPIRHYDVHTRNSHVPVGFRRATGSGVNVFYLESFIDELAHAAGKDPYAYRRELIARNLNFRDRDDWLNALDMVAEMSGWGTPLPEGWARGIAIDDRRRPSRGTVALCAQVVTVSVSRRGLLRLERIDVVFDEGFSFVNPLSVRKQIEGQIAWGLGDTIWQEINIKDGRVVEGNFDEYQIARIADYPLKVNIRFLKTDNKWISGVGEEAIPQVAPAVAQAVFKITGKRIRSLPLGNKDLSWA